MCFSKPKQITPTATAPAPPPAPLETKPITPVLNDKDGGGEEARSTRAAAKGTARLTIPLIGGSGVALNVPQ